MNKKQDGHQPSLPDEKLIPAKWPILAIVAVAVGMSSFAWLYWYSIGNEIKERWGSENTLLIARAPQAELWALDEGGTSDAAQAVLIGDRLLSVERRRDLVKEPPPGWTHVRTLLVRDAAYDFNETPTCEPDWRYAISFGDGARRVVVLLSLDCPRARLADGVREVLADGTIRSERTLRKSEAAGEPLSIDPSAAGLKEFLSELFPAADGEQPSRASVGGHER